ncbi:Uncharacterised protein [Escherichia coli]|nr:Uncharacterised protein [Escherichia coli]VVZ93539.1 Uncharacterised protein [Escherichia coli]
MYLTSKATATSIYHTSDSYVIEFSISSFIQLPTSRTSCIVVGLDIVADFGVLNGAVLDEAGPDECLPVLDHERQSYAISGCRGDGEAVSQEDNLRLHAGWRILHADTHPRGVILPVAGDTNLDVVHRAEVAINVGYRLSISGDG